MSQLSVAVGSAKVTIAAQAPASLSCVISAGHIMVGSSVSFTITSKLQVAGGIQMADDTATASAAKVGTLKYRVSGNNSYVDMCMQTGTNSYDWVNIVQNVWN